MRHAFTFNVYTTDQIDNPARFETLAEAVAWADETGLDAAIHHAGSLTGCVASKNRDAFNGKWQFRSTTKPGERR